MQTMAAPIIKGLADISARYEGFILDIWGVMHQGGPAYDHALDCLRHLHDAGKRIVFLSNAPRRAHHVARILSEKGVDPAWYDHVVSSGEGGRIALAERQAPMDTVGRRFVMIGAKDDDDLLEGLDFEHTGTVEEADFLLAIGLDAEKPQVEDHETLLAAACARGLPMVCVNPDKLVVRLGNREPCAGALAVRYEALGGTVHYVGKPHGAVYELCMNRLGISDKTSVLTVGDGLETDIRGANAHGFDSLLVTGGLLADALGIAADSAPEAAALDEACTQAGAAPRYATPLFTW